MANDPVGKHVLDRAKIKLAFPGSVFGDVGEPNLVRAGRCESVPGAAMVVNSGDEIIVNRRAWPASLAPPFGMGGLDPADPAKPVNPVLAGGNPGILKLLG